MPSLCIIQLKPAPFAQKYGPKSAGSLPGEAAGQKEVRGQLAYPAGSLIR